MPDTEDPAPPRAFHLPDLVRLERKAWRTGKLEDCMAVWALPYYAQRKYWFKLFIGLNYAIFARFLCNWTMIGIPDPTFNAEYVKIYKYLSDHSGILPMDECLGGDFNMNQVTSWRGSGRYASAGSKRMSLMPSLRSRDPSGELELRARRASAFIDSYSFTESVSEQELIYDGRQSKLSQEQLTELQRSTHFDKKELQQWYKGTRLDLILLSSSSL